MNETEIQSAQTRQESTQPDLRMESVNAVVSGESYRIKNCASDLFLDDGGGQLNAEVTLSPENPDPYYPDLRWSAAEVPGYEATEKHFRLICGHNLALTAAESKGTVVSVTLQTPDPSNRMQIWHLVGTDRGYMIQSDLKETVLEDTSGRAVLSDLAPVSSPKYLSQNWLLLT